MLNTENLTIRSPLRKCWREQLGLNVEMLREIANGEK